MIPTGFTPKPVVSAFFPPYDEDYTPLSETVLGGFAINDGSKGRKTQRWVVYWDAVASAIGVTDESGVLKLSVSRSYLVTTVSMAFDANMNPAIAYQSSTGSHLYWYDSAASGYTTLTIADGTSCRAGLDLIDNVLAAQSDILFAYIREENLYYRVQRERYATERLIGPAIPGGILYRVAPDKGGRLQFKIGKPLS